MERFVVLVDAGYVYAQGGIAHCGTRARKDLVLNAAGFMHELEVFLQPHAGRHTLLRTYWYDGAKDGVPTTEQQEIGSQPYVKLRLGRLNSQNQQKGVDALVYRDLMTLATERAVSIAFLLSGDDDLREGVTFAQDRGVQVVLVGIRGRQHASQSRGLAMAADQTLFLPPEVVKRTLARVTSAAAPPLPAVDPEGAVASAGANHAKKWLAHASASALAALVAGRPVIPKPLDVDLIKSAEADTGLDLRENPKAKRQHRAAFWVESQLPRPRRRTAERTTTHCQGPQNARTLRSIRLHVEPSSMREVQISSSERTVSAPTATLTSSVPSLAPRAVSPSG